MKKYCLSIFLAAFLFSLAASAVCESTYVTLKALLSDASALGTPFVTDTDSDLSCLGFDFSAGQVALTGRNASGSAEACLWTDVSLVKGTAVLTYVCQNFSDYHNSSNDWFIGFRVEEDSDFSLISDEETAKSLADLLEENFGSSDVSSSAVSSSRTSSAGAGSSYASSGEKNALESAKNHIRYSAYSYEKLIDMLKYEGYSDAEAKYGAENCGANWNAEALEAAEDHIKYGAYSYSGLIDMLEYDGFSKSQIQYAAGNCAVDWNREALEAAEDHIKYGAYSYSGLIDMLEYDGFSKSQIQYAAGNCAVDWNREAEESAKSHMKYGSYTRSTLLDQLKREGFTNTQAEYGVSHAY